MLLSSRNTWTLYDVDLRSGAVRWRLGGEHSSFKLGPGTRTYWQHDAEWQPGGLISVFDNGSDPPKEKQSRGPAARPEPRQTHTVTLVKQFTNPTKTLLASSQGNMLSLPGGNWLMGYGGLPNFTEYNASGHVLLDGTLGRNVQDFRTYLSPWSGQAPGSPSVVAAPRLRRDDRGVGELERRHRSRLLAGARGRLAERARAACDGRRRRASRRRSRRRRAGPYVAVQALSSAGRRDRHLGDGQGLMSRPRPVIAGASLLVAIAGLAGARGAVPRRTRPPAHASVVAELRAAAA